MCYLKPNEMVEVFRTNVENASLAAMLIRQIHKAFSGYAANFDLDDCDRILRIQSAKSKIAPQPVIQLLKDFGFYAEVLPDDVSVAEDFRKFSKKIKGTCAGSNETDAIYP